MQKATKEALTFCFFYIQSTTNTTIFIAIVQIILLNQQYFNKFGNNITIHPSRVAIYLIDYLNFQPETLRNASGFFFCSIIFHPQTSRNGKTIPKNTHDHESGCRLASCMLPVPLMAALCRGRSCRSQNSQQERGNRGKGTTTNGEPTKQRANSTPFRIQNVHPCAPLGCFRLN